MRVAIVGAGKMGQAIQAEAESRGHTVVALVGSAENRLGAALARLPERGAELVFEFTRPDAAAPNLMALADARLPVVTGTTGWLDRLPEVQAHVEAAGAALLYAANFSMGLQVMVQAAEALARAARDLPQFDGVLVETHHAAKRDAPSGTALTLQTALRGVDADRAWPISSIRVGAVPGTHEVVLDGRHESLTLTHAVRDRRVFAEGAVAAGEWLLGRRGVFTFSDMMRGDG